MTSIIILIFCAGYLCITLEHIIKINKAAIAVLTGVSCWAVYILMSPDHHHITTTLIEHMGDLSGILFFLMGAMTIVELIDMHYGFEIITSRIGVKKKLHLLWIIGILTFFLSAALDNLTTTIVMISLLMKFSLEKEERLLFIGMIIIAANSGGAWSPIGDVTTTMLWIDNRISTFGIIYKLFLPSLISALVPLLLLSIKIKGHLKRDNKFDAPISNAPKQKLDRNIVFFFGIGGLMFVPVFKSVTHLPPFMGMLFVLGLLWLLTEVIHAKKHESIKQNFSAAQALTQIDMPSILFFLGILISIAALEATGVLRSLSIWLDQNIHNLTLIDILIGLLSAVIDNVPLVAGAMGIYTLQQYPTDHHFWIFLSYCAGTGGSALIIGSAAGVAAMGIAKINFLWYVKKITPLALAGYFSGVVVYLIQQLIFK